MQSSVDSHGEETLSLPYPTLSPLFFPQMGKVHRFRFIVLSLPGGTICSSRPLPRKAFAKTVPLGALPLPADLHISHGRNPSRFTGITVKSPLVYSDPG